MSFNKSGADVLFLKGEYAAAAQMYLDGAKEGDEEAAFAYAICLWRGIGVPRDVSEAKTFFTYARDLEGGDSCYNLAMIYMEGEGVVQNYRTALAYMSDAAELGSVEAMLYLGMAYTVGYLLYPEITSFTRIPFHKPECRDASLSLMGYSQTDIEAEEELRSSIIHADPRRAFEYFKCAAYSDPTYAQELVAKGKFLYARCFIDGFGTEFNRTRGVNLMLKAGKSGSEEAIAFLAEAGIPIGSLTDGDPPVGILPN